MPGKLLISFCLWGNEPIYTIGAIRNADLAKEIYPGWRCRFYVGTSTPSKIVDELRLRTNTEVIIMDSPGDWTSMFWRFYPAGEPEIDVMLSRDTDSRLSLREKMAVEEWLKSDKGFHIMRDFPAHQHKILGGMWGAKKGAVSNMNGLISDYILKNSAVNKKGIDQDFLREYVYPLIKDNCLIHDEFFEHKPFPSKRKGYEFVGQVFNEHDMPNQRNIAELKYYLSAGYKFKKVLGRIIPRNWKLPRKIFKSIRLILRRTIK